MRALRRRGAARAPPPYPHPGRGSTRLPPGRHYPAKARTAATGTRRCRADSSTEQLPFARLHLGAVVVAEEVQKPVDERPVPVVSDDRGAEDDVAELAGNPVRQRVAAVDREREHVRGLVDAEVLALQLAHLVGADEGEPELAVLDPLRPQRAPRQLDGGLALDLVAGPVVHLDEDHRSRAVPVSSACSLYASTIRWTSLCRTTSRFEKRTKPIPSTDARMSCTWISPERCSRGRAIWVMSPVTTTFEPNPRRVRNICICSGEVFCASSRMMNESFSVRPRMKASGATSIVPRSMYAVSFSGSIMS